MRIAVVGTGYVGLVAGTCFSESGNNVICVDVDEKKIEKLKAGEIPIYEPGLEKLIERNTKEGRLSFTTDLDAAVKASLINFIAVGTPPAEDGSADLKYVLAAARGIGRSMNGYKIIVDKSTVPVGTAHKVKKAISEVTNHPFDVVSNPEFLKEGAAIDDFMKPDRVVIGSEDPRVEEIMKELYSPFCRTGKPIITMDLLSAELTKYAANAMLATRISFMNEIANICERVGANVHRVREGIGTDSRIGPGFLFPGIGYGGSCFPKDVQAIMRTATEYDYEFKILDAVERVNQAQKQRLFERVEQHFDGKLDGLTVAVWGLAFKPNTDDMREAPSVSLINRLLEAGVKVQVTDPEAIEEAQEVFGDRIQYHDRAMDTLQGADALLVVTEWSEFRNPDFETMKTLMNHAVIFDGRNIYNPKWMHELGFTYYGIGIPVVG